MSLQAIQKLRDGLMRAVDLINELRADVKALQAEIDALKKPPRQKAP